jgi:glutaredoxin 3
MSRVKVYSTGTCPICDKTKNLLKKWQVDYEEIRVDLSSSALKEMMVKSNHARTVPQIVIDDECIGGFSELTELHMDGELDHLLENT